LDAFWYYIADRIICRELIDMQRVSPSLVVTPCVRVSHEIPWMKIKDSTHSCFPGGHAVTLLFFATSYTFFAKRQLGAYAIGYSLFRCLPRLILGAHWLSDILVGSTTVVLLSLSWTLCTPFHIWAANYIEEALRIVFSRLKQLAKTG
jgi:membrane-associated phospholipid phosphatase